MNKAIQEMLMTLSRESGLHFCEESAALWGEMDGYPVVLYVPNASYPKNLQAVFGANQNGETMGQDAGKQLKKTVKGLTGATVAPTSITVTFRYKNAQDAAALLGATAQALRNSGMTRGCQHCGKDVPTVGASVGGAYMSVCDTCFEALRGQLEVQHGQRAARTENVVAGTVGALAGSLLGVACIVILSRLGYVAVISGIVMAVCTLIRYEKLGRKLTKKGIVICSVLMLVMTYAANQIDLAIEVMQVLEVNFFDAYRLIPMLFEQEVVNTRVYWGNMALTYVFTAIGAVPMILSNLRNQAERDRILRMDQSSHADI